MSRRHPKEVHDFIRANVKGATTKELARLTAEKFGIDFTCSAMKSYKANYGLKSGTPCGNKAGEGSAVFPLAITQYIQANYEGVGPKEMAQHLNDMFGTQYKAPQLKGWYANHGISSGLDGRFQKGCISHNKGQKGLRIPGSEKGWYQKGSTPYNKQPIGTVLKKSDGYLWRKLGEGARDWRQEHRLIWEEANGEIPEGGLLVFLDRDKENCTLENLALVNHQENLELNRKKLRSASADFTQSGILVARLNVATRKRGRRGGQSCQK